jgi:hypothetical protein
MINDRPFEIFILFAYIHCQELIMSLCGAKEIREENKWYNDKKIIGWMTELNGGEPLKWL